MEMRLNTGAESSVEREYSHELLSPHTKTTVSPDQRKRPMGYSGGSPGYSFEKNENSFLLRDGKGIIKAKNKMLHELISSAINNKIGSGMSRIANPVVKRTGGMFLLSELNKTTGNGGIGGGMMFNPPVGERKGNTIRAVGKSKPGNNSYLY